MSHCRGGTGLLIKINHLVPCLPVLVNAQTITNSQEHMRDMPGAEGRATVRWKEPQREIRATLCTWGVA